MLKFVHSGGNFTPFRCVNVLIPQTKTKPDIIMTRLLILLTLTLFTTSGLIAQSSNFYTIQVGTFIDANHNDFDGLRELGLVHAQEVGGNLTQVYLGGYRDKAEADKMLRNVQQKGYPNAFVKELLAQEGQVSTVVQMATRQRNTPLEWEEFARAGDLFAILNGDMIKIVTGPYASSSEAKAGLSSVRSLGYNDAFVKNVNSVYLIPIGQFETGVKEELIPMEFGNTGSQPSSYDNTAPAMPQEYSVLSPRTPDAGQPAVSEPQLPGSMDIPGSYDYYPGATGTKGLSASSSPASVAPMGLPTINGKIKRTSAINLQKILKAKGAYSGSLDGYYGPGTKAGYEKYLTQNRFMQKYAYLAENAPLPGNETNNSQLQALVNRLPTDASAAVQLRNRSEPVAKAYVAYEQFVNYGPSAEVNQLMIAANRAAFDGQPLSNLPFDPNATYSYQDLGQLILHLHYIHCARRTDIAVPCWMQERHPKEAARAMQACSAFVGRGLKLQGCGQFETWPEVRMLVMVAGDLNTDAQFDQKRLAQAASERSRLYMAPKALNSTEQKAVQKWSDNLIAGLNSWGTRDPMNQQLVTTFRVLFFQSQVRLEDYFMQKGYKEAEAKGLALAALHTLVAYHTQRFV